MATQFDPSSADTLHSSKASIRHFSSKIERDVIAMHRQGEPDEVIALAFGLSVLQVRNIVSEQMRQAACADKDDPAPIIRRVPRKSRHPDRCPHCGAMLTVKPCLLCYCRTWPG